MRACVRVCACVCVKTVQQRLLDMAHVDLSTLIANSRRQEQSAESDKAAQRAKDIEDARRESGIHTKGVYKRVYERVCKLFYKRNCKPF